MTRFEIIAIFLIIPSWLEVVWEVKHLNIRWNATVEAKAGSNNLSFVKRGNMLKTETSRKRTISLGHHFSKNKAGNAANKMVFSWT